MRITGGQLSGRTLITPKTRAIRPVRDAVRLSLFNILDEVVPGSRFLDLFAGTGSVGIEALSRGAREATFVDDLPEALEVIGQNLAALGLSERAEVLGEDVFYALGHLSGHDLVFIGPPYGKGLEDRTLEKLAGSDCLNEDAIVVTELFQKDRVEARYGTLVQIDARRYGDNRLVFYRREAGAA